jgi:hypothetical protein
MSERGLQCVLLPAEKAGITEDTEQTSLDVHYNTIITFPFPLNIMLNDQLNCCILTLLAYKIFTEQRTPTYILSPCNNENIFQSP